MKLAVLLTCYNRKEKTLNCINKLLLQLEQLPYEYKIYVCDDKSTDGTFEGLKALLPNHDIFQSTGDFYWCKGMYTVMKKAAEDLCDYYLMVNDDVAFFENALDIMFSSYEKTGRCCGIVGATKALESDVYTYGGRDDENNKIEPSEKMEQCCWANWNCFLTDRAVVEKVGLIDGKYQHAWGDYDYSFRMRKAGLPMYMARDYVGRCDTNSVKGTYKDASLTRRVRLKKMFSPKGVPFGSYMRYHMRTQGGKGFLRYLYGYMSIIGYILIRKEIR